jgi:hypothetical protein
MWPSLLSLEEKHFNHVKRQKRLADEIRLTSLGPLAGDLDASEMPVDEIFEAEG